MAAVLAVVAVELFVAAIVAHAFILGCLANRRRDHDDEGKVG